MQISYEELRRTLEDILQAHGVPSKIAVSAAQNYAKNTLDGVHSHGVNRFPRTIDYLDRGLIKGDARPVMLNAFGCLERWDGCLGLGNVNAVMMMNRAIALAHEQGIGLIAIQNTNHWMRGGAYGWQAADAGCIGMCWTNTRPNTPVWGGQDNRIGNNPFVLSIPRSSGAHVVLDTAMTQFSNGRLEQTAMNGEALPVPGGYDANGWLTNDSTAILNGGRHLTIGYWKGSGLSVVLDLAAAVLSGGNTVTDVGRRYGDEIGLSQVFIAIDAKVFPGFEFSDAAVDRAIEDIKNSLPVSSEKEIMYPGERTLRTRMVNLKRGIPIADEVWQKILTLMSAC